MDCARSATSRSVASYRRTSAGARASSPAAARTARSTDVGTLPLPSPRFGRQPPTDSRIVAGAPRHGRMRGGHVAAGRSYLRLRAGQRKMDRRAERARGIDQQRRRAGVSIGPAAHLPRPHPRSSARIRRGRARRRRCAGSARGRPPRGNPASPPPADWRLVLRADIDLDAVQPTRPEGVIDGERQRGRHDAPSGHRRVDPVTGVRGAEGPPHDVAQVDVADEPLLPSASRRQIANGIAAPAAPTAAGPGRQPERGRRVQLVPLCRAGWVPTGASQSRCPPHPTKPRRRSAGTGAARTGPSESTAGQPGGRRTHQLHSPRHRSPRDPTAARPRWSQRRAWSTRSPSTSRPLASASPESVWGPPGSGCTV